MNTFSRVGGFRPALVGAGLFWATIGSSPACIQGHRFNPAKPMDSKEVVAGLKALQMPAPKIELPKLELSGMPIALANSGVSAVAGADDPLTGYRVYVRDFEEGRMKEGFNEVLDYGVALIRLGRNDDAVRTLVALEKAQPGAYATAANLGTAYELAGKPDEALVWIERGIERNPEGHHATEWLHAAILRTKIKLREAPDWLKEHSVLEAADKRNPEEIVRAIDFQLGERLAFVAPKDAIVCDLFYQAAVRVSGPDAAKRREHYASESLRFGDERKAALAARPKT